MKAAALALLGACAGTWGPGAWQRPALAAAAIATTTCDMASTESFLDRRAGVYEINPLLGRHPDPGVLTFEAVASSLVEAGVALWLPKKWALLIDGPIAVVELNWAIHNSVVGGAAVCGFGPTFRGNPQNIFP